MRAPAFDERERQILMLWERGTGLGRFARDEALLSAMGDPPKALGARNAWMLALRAALFPSAWPLTSHCPECGTACEFEADSKALAEALSAFSPPAECTVRKVNGRTFRLRAPEVDDLRAISTAADPAKAAQALIGRCVCGPAPELMDEETLHTLSQDLERLDPGAVVSFALLCPACRHGWSAAVDVGEALWSELSRAAEALLIEIDALARAYGWTETEILRLTPARRAAYLQLVTAP